MSVVADPELDRLYETVSGYFALLAEPTRLRILNALCDGERSVNEVVAQVSSTQTNVSRHLNMMYGRGVLARRREGPMTFYSIADETVVTLCRAACINVAGRADARVPAKAVRRFMPKS